MAVSRGPFGYVPAVTRPTSRIAALASVPLLAMALAVSSPALAQTSSQSGVWIDAQPGLGLGGSPFGPSFGTRASVGYWKGNYDFDYLLGRAWGVGLATRVDLFGPELRVAPSCCRIWARLFCDRTCRALLLLSSGALKLDASFDW